jgi:hypothetical protein
VRLFRRRPKPLTRAEQIAALSARIRQNLADNETWIHELQTLIDEDTMTTTVPEHIERDPLPALGLGGAIIPTSAVNDLSPCDVGTWVEFEHDGVPVSGVLVKIVANRWKIDTETSITLGIKTPEKWSWSEDVKADVLVTLRHDIDPLTGKVSGGL